MQRLARFLLIAALIGGASLHGARAAQPAAAGGVDVSISETAGVARRDVPTEVSLPFARGVLSTTGTQAPSLDGAAARVLERWADGSVRWLQADFPSTVPAGGRAVRHLAPGRGTRQSAAAIRLSRENDGLRAEVPGKLTVTVPAHGPSLAQIAAGGATVAIPWPALRLGDTPLAAPDEHPVEIETEGGRESEILVRARQSQGLQAEVRIALTADQPWVRLRYTLTHMGETTYLPLAALTVTIPWPSARGELGIGGSAQPVTFEPPQRVHDVVHREARAALLDGKDAGQRADGAARVRGGGRAWSVAVPWFWQEYPKRLAVSPKGIAVDLVAAGGDPLLLGVGAAKTWELWIAVHPDAQAPPLIDLARAMTTPPLATVPPTRIVESGALPYAIAPEAPGAAGFLTALGTAIDQYRGRAMSERWDDGPPGKCATRTAVHEHQGFYGALNWGDWNFPGFHDDIKGCDAWGNLEYDLPLVLGLTYLATGDADTWTLFQNATRHYRDVDIIHHWPGHADRVGLNHPHKVRHFATDAANTVDLGHVWLDGLLLHYRLTGEQRSRRAALRMADALSALTSHAHNPRQFGWPMIALAAAYEASGEARYRTAALAYAANAARKFPPNPNAEWKMGILAEGMAAVHRATGDAAVRAWLDDYGRQLLVPPASPRDPRLVAPAGYLAELTGDARFTELARTTAGQLAPGSWGKPLASVGRIGFALLGPLARVGYRATPDPGAPPPASDRGSQSPSPPPVAPSPPAGR